MSSFCPFQDDCKRLLPGLHVPLDYSLLDIRQEFDLLQFIK